MEGTDVNTASAEHAFFHQLIRFSDLLLAYAKPPHGLQYTHILVSCQYSVIIWAVNFLWKGIHVRLRSHLRIAFIFIRRVIPLGWGFIRGYAALRYEKVYFFVWGFKLLCDKHNCLCYYKNDISENDFCGNESIFIFFYPYTSHDGDKYLQRWLLIFFHYYRYNKNM